MKAASLTVRDLSRSFGGLRAVDRVSFTATAAKITTVIGPNGAGKSTLFNLISGALHPDQGTVALNDRDVTSMSPELLKCAGVSRSFQITNLFSDLTVGENLRIAAQFLEPARSMFLPIRKSTRALRKCSEVLNRFGLAAKAGVLAGALSHGEQRRLEVAMCLASNPGILMLDEPTQGMSHGDTAETAKMLKELSKEVTILLVEHDIGLVMSLSDHVVVMHQGRKLSEGSPAEVRANADVQAAYFGHH
ncbi:ABC transporter ATP-binding protein [Variovorax ginsengisoli]|uniref:ABC transporter ATP-binding protein n=1 Tax=Variovorax ginsengisoli TaxID=363844 RepID=A0ABT8SC87_9BURK|nr:ABC transporter ATP-binding protein [Variovorax ginsengisoli]MDN8617362.1 ABC transporter ATP-binding protein [Variovorax ginsengisoli]MDO1536532.1 ABC transporter ATP-binding protein [Variovorax ginsengisoli]